MKKLTPTLGPIGKAKSLLPPRTAVKKAETINDFAQLTPVSADGADTYPVRPTKR